MRLFTLTFVLCAGVVFVSSASAQGLLSYDAGIAGSPAVAPEPTTQGWTYLNPAGSGVVVTDASPDGSTGLNAWVIVDQGSSQGQTGHYRQLLSAQDVTAADLLGWELELRMRVVQTSGLDVYAEYAGGTSSSSPRFLAWFETQGNDVLVSMNLVGTSYVCSGAMDGNYHTFLCRKQPGATDAEFHYDGQFLGVFPAAASNGNAPNGGVAWGTGSSAGQGTVNVNSVRMRFLENNGAAFCDGSGSGTTCPCGNLGGAGEGCLNSSGIGGLLMASGDANLAGDTLVLTATQCPPLRSALFIQANNTANGGSGNIFGDGLRCVQGTQRKVQYVPTDGAGHASTSVSISQVGVVGPGDTRYYQYWYRDPLGPCSNQFNLTNGWQVTW